MPKKKKKSLAEIRKELSKKPKADVWRFMLQKPKTNSADAAVLRDFLNTKYWKVFKKSVEEIIGMNEEHVLAAVEEAREAKNEDEKSAAVTRAIAKLTVMESYADMLLFLDPPKKQSVMPNPSPKRSAPVPQKKDAKAS